MIVVLEQHYNSTLGMVIVYSNDNENRNLGIPLHTVSDIEIAEITKIAENAHRYLQIAFAEDLYLYCKTNNLSFQNYVKPSILNGT